MYISFDDGNLVCYGIEYVMLLFVDGEDALSQFQPPNGCSAIQALGKECVLVTSQHSINSACIYDQSNNNTLSISNIIASLVYVWKSNIIYIGKIIMF